MCGRVFWIILCLLCVVGVSVVSWCILFGSIFGFVVSLFGGF